MAVNLSKGSKVNLSKEAPGLNNILIGLGWDVKDAGASGDDFDLDAIAFACKGGKVRKDEDFVFFNNRFGVTGIELSEDNRTGEGDGDDESIKIDLSKLDTDIEEIIFAVVLFEAEEKNQNFGQVDNASMRIVDEATGTELALFDLSFDASEATGLYFGRLVKRGDAWIFDAKGDEYNEGIAAICTKFGVNV